MTDVGRLYTVKNQQLISIVYYSIYDKPQNLINEKPWLGELIIEYDLNPDNEYVIELQNKQKIVCSIALLKVDLPVGESKKYHMFILTFFEF